MSRTKDEEDPLTEVIKECNAFAPDLAVDIHNNSDTSGSGDGAEVFYKHNDATSKAFAQNVLDEIKAIGQNSRGIKTKLNAQGNDYFGFIRQTYGHSILAETAFISNKNDIKIIDTEEERKAMGKAIAKGIIKTLKEMKIIE